MHAQVLAGAAVVALIARIFFPFLKTFFSPLRNVPGPALARFTDLWYLWRVRKGGFEWDNIELHRKHGEPVLLHVFLSAPNLYKQKQTYLQLQHR